MSLPKLDRNLGAPDFEDVVEEAQATNNFKPLWNRFVKNRFFVAIKRVNDGGKADFRLVLPQTDAKAFLEISEYKDKLGEPYEGELAFLTAAQILKRMPDGMAMRLLLASQHFDISVSRIDWLKKSLEASRQALIKKQDAARAAVVSPPQVRTGDTLPPINAISMPLPDQEQQQGKGWDFRVSTLRADTNVPGAHAPILTATPAFTYESLELEPTKPVAKETSNLAAFDSSKLKTKQVTHAGLGIELAVPTSWQDLRNDTALKLVDNERGLVIEINGRRREETSFVSWVDSRIPIVQKELPFLSQTSSLQEAQGRLWGDRISGKVIDFKGNFPLDQEPSRYRFYCIQTPKYFISIGIKANESQYQQLLPLLQWVVGGIELYEVMPSAVQAQANPYAATATAHVTEYPAAPSPFSLSFQGRLGRMRFVAYSLVAFVPLMLTFIGFALMGMNFWLMATGLVLFVLSLLRPMALRLHDLGLSAKWLFLVILLPALIAVAGGKNPSQMGQVLGWIMYLVFLLVPGNSDENDYGPPCPPNSITVNVVACLVLVLNVIGNGAAYKYERDLLRASNGPVSSDESGFGFSPPHQSYTVNFPRKPIEDMSVANAPKVPGFGAAHMFRSSHKKLEFMVQDIVVEVAPPDRSMTLDMFAKAFANSVGSTLSSEKVVIGGYAARALTVKTFAGPYQNLRFLYVGKRLYILAVQARSEKEGQEDAQDFFDSFQVNEL